MNRQWIFAALGAAIGLSAASAALAGSDRYYGPQGYQVQTWQDIEQDRLDIQRQIRKEYHLDDADNAAPPKHLRRAAHRANTGALLRRLRLALRCEALECSTAARRRQPG